MTIPKKELTKIDKEKITIDLTFPKKELAKIDKEAKALNIKSRMRFLRSIIACRKKVIGTPAFWIAYKKNSGMQAKKKKKK